MIDKEKPISSQDISFEITPDIATNWTQYLFAEDGSNAGVFTSKTFAADKVIAISATDGTDTVSYAWNNCNAVSLTGSHSADDNQSLTLSFRVAAEDSAGIPNFQFKAGALSGMPAWSSLDS
jgi:hypothetical protein